MNALKKIFGHWYSTGHTLEYSHLPVGYVFDTGDGQLWKKRKDGTCVCVSKGTPDYGKSCDFSWNGSFPCGLVRNTSWGRHPK